MALSFNRPFRAATSPEFSSTLSFENLHTGERVNVPYWNNGTYVAQALDEITWVLRDHRNNTARAIDLEFLETLSALRVRIGQSRPFQVISGYRSPASNSALHEATTGVAAQSLHVEGKAIDFRMSSIALKDLRRDF